MREKKKLKRVERIPRGIRERTAGEYNIYALSSWKHILYVGGPYILLVIPLIIGIKLERYLLFTFSIAYLYAILGMAWDLFANRMGLFHFGIALHFGMGGYFTAYLNAIIGLHPLASIIAGSLLGTLISVAILSPILRLRGIYFAIVTLILPILMMNIFIAVPQLGKEEGIVGVQSISTPVGYYYILAVLAISILFTLKKIEFDTYFGKKIEAIRENEWGMKALGYNPAVYRIYVSLIGGFIISLCGSIYTTQIAFVGPPFFATEYSLTPILAAVIGGSVGPWGPFLGALILIPLLEMLRIGGPLRTVMISLILILVLAFRPEGIMGYIQRKYHYKDLVKFEEVRERG